jgi:hypothetical protein
VGVLDERRLRVDVDACLDDLVSGDAEVVLLEIAALDTWRLLRCHDDSSYVPGWMSHIETTVGSSGTCP